MADEIPKIDLWAERDFCLALLEVAVKMENGPQPWLDGRAMRQPYFIVEGRSGFSRIFIDNQQIKWQGEEVARRIKNNRTYADWLITSAGLAYDKIETILKKESSLVGLELESFVTDLKTLWSWYTGVWWGIEYLESVPSEAATLEKFMAFRRRAEKVVPNADTIFKKTVKDLQLTSEECGNLLTIEEILSKKIPSDDVLAERKRYYLLTYDGLFIGEEIKNVLFKVNLIVPQTSSDIAELRGAVACAGKVSGIVTVIHSKEEADLFTDGHILVASTTVPSYINAIKKCSAIVADEGGIISHAAIVSRELKKPCIIGTKIATKVLKDGDMVEVDAEKGIVKIIN